MLPREWEKEGRGGRPARRLCAASHNRPPFAVLRGGVTHSGPAELGFTLVEVLVVVAVLGVIAAVVVLNITGFVGAGAEDSANTEAHQVQTAVIAYMQFQNLSTWDGVVGDGSSEEVEDYLTNPGRLQATYTFSGGKVASATALPDGRWAGCSWVTAKYGWECPD